MNRPCEVWGVLNITPDSFSDGGMHHALDDALRHAHRMLEEGADVLDIGGESSRPKGPDYGDGAKRVSIDEEIQRVLPVVKALAATARLSIDTVRAEVAAACLDAGAAIINDISGGTDPELLRVVAAHGECDLVLMHNRGRGEIEGAQTTYEDVVEEVRLELRQAVQRAEDAGVSRGRIWVDPGIGFAKKPRDSARLVSTLAEYSGGLPVLFGSSRKSFISHLHVPASPSERLGGSLATAILAAQAGAAAVRVHDVFETSQALALLGACGEAS